MFIKDNWTLNDIKELEIYLENIKNEEKVEWTRKIINTKLKVLAIKLPKIKEIAKEILKGNYLSFLDIMPDNSFEELTISGYLISEIKDFKVQEKYLKKYALKCDNWSNCDTLSFKIKNNEENYLKLSKKFIKSASPFVRRVGIDILFALLKTDQYLNDIYNILDSFENETEYYVNMVNAWLLCELVIKHRNQTIEYLKNNHLNNFTINKGIQKCCDSFRITVEDKEMLKKYKRKSN